MKLIVFLFCGIVFFSETALCLDELFTKDGQRFTGEIVSENENSIDFKSSEGLLILNRSDLLHIEKNIPEQAVQDKPKKAFDSFYDTFKGLSKSSISFARKSLTRYHRFIFSRLSRQPWYRSFTKVQLIRSYKRKHPSAYILGIYMLMLLCFGVAFSIVEKVSKSFFCRLFHIKEKYDL